MLDYTDRALSLTELDPQASDLRLVLLTNKALKLSEIDRHAEALAPAREALELAERTGATRVHVIRSALAILYFDTGDWDDALAELDQASAEVEQAYLRQMVHGMFALIAGHRGDRETAARHLRLLDDSDIDSDRGNSYYLRRARSLAAEQDGHLTEATAVLAECLDPGVAERMPGVWSLMPPLARLALAVGDRETADGGGAAGGGGGRISVGAVQGGCGGSLPGPGSGGPGAGAFCGRILPGFRPAVFPGAGARGCRGPGGRSGVSWRRPSGTWARRSASTPALGAAWDVEHAGARLRRYGIGPCGSRSVGGRRRGGRR